VLLNPDSGFGRAELFSIQHDVSDEGQFVGDACTWQIGGGCILAATLWNRSSAATSRRMSDQTFRASLSLIHVARAALALLAL
jgi:hypothetical protein